MKALVIMTLFLMELLLILGLLKKINPNFILGANSQQTPPPQHRPPTPNEVYSTMQPFYESFACIVCDSLKSMCQGCKLAVPSGPAEVYCTVVSNRIRHHQGRWIFNYEVSREAPLFGGGMAKQPSIPAKDIAKVLAGNLSANLCGGYAFTGPVYGWDIEDNRIRIEVIGVDRTYPVEEITEI